MAGEEVCRGCVDQVAQELEVEEVEWRGQVMEWGDQVVVEADLEQEDSLERRLS